MRACDVFKSPRNLFILITIVVICTYNLKSSRLYNATDLMSDCLPNAIIIGAKKTGTGVLKGFLRHHPQILIQQSEPHFFDKNYHMGLQWYNDLLQQPDMSQCRGKTIMEKSPHYFVDSATPERIAAYNSSIKLILLVRDPVERLLSDHVHALARLESGKGQNSRDLQSKITKFVGAGFSETAKIMQPSLYAKYYTKWLQYFPKEQILIIDSDNFTDGNPGYQMRLLEKFLGFSGTFFTDDKFELDSTKGFYCWKQETKLKCAGSTKGRPKPEFEPSLVEELYQFFCPRNAEFNRLSDVDFKWKCSRKKTESTSTSG